MITLNRFLQRARVVSQRPLFSCTSNADADEGPISAIPIVSYAPKDDVPRALPWQRRDRRQEMFTLTDDIAPPSGIPSAYEVKPQVAPSPDCHAALEEAPAKKEAKSSPLPSSRQFGPEGRIDIPIPVRVNVETKYWPGPTPLMHAFRQVKEENWIYKHMYPIKRYCTVPVINLDAGQPTAETHPEVLKPGEIMPGVSFEEMSSRRKKLMSELPFGSIVILVAAPVKGMTELIPYPYRQNSDYLYYTGCLQPAGLALLYSEGELCMFMPDPFIEGAFWEGRWAHAPEAIEFLKADRAYNISELEKHVPRLLKQARGVYIDGEVLPDSELGQLPAYKEAMEEKKIHSLSKFSHEARWIKSPSELNLMRQAAGMACQGFLQTMKVSPFRQHEHLLAATIEYECKLRGAQSMAFPPVVAGGANATVIHYSRNDQLIGEGQMVLMDAGCEYFGYVSDVTRTWSPSGKISNAQRDIYEAVLTTFENCLKLYRPGATLLEIHSAATDKLRKAAKELGIIQKLEDYPKINPTCIGHYLGMDVHDCKAISENRPLVPGVVLTIEPGLYIPQSDQFPKWCQGIGIRIEDEVLITDSGNEVLTASIPKQLCDVERWLHFGLI